MISETLNDNLRKNNRLFHRNSEVMTSGSHQITAVRAEGNGKWNLVSTKAVKSRLYVLKWEQS